MALLQDVIYQNLLHQRRSDLHGKIAVAVEGLVGENPERLEDLTVLGHHFGLSAWREKGARYLREAGDRARLIYANDDALRFYEQALAALADIDRAPLRLELGERIADLYGPTGRREIAHENYDKVLKGYREAGDRVASARILRKIGRLFWDAGRRDNAESRYAEAASLLNGADAPIEQAHLWQERGRLAFRTGDHARAAEWAEKALDCTRALTGEHAPEVVRDTALAIAEALNTKGVALARLGRNLEAVQEVERSVAVAEAAGLQSVACRGYTNLGVLYTIVDPAHAMEVCRRGLECRNPYRRSRLPGTAPRPIWRSPAAHSPTAAPRRACLPPKRRSKSTARSTSASTSPVPLTVLAQIHQCHGAPGPCAPLLRRGARGGARNGRAPTAVSVL